MIIDARTGEVIRVGRPDDRRMVRRIAARALGLNPDGPLGSRIAARIVC